MAQRRQFTLRSLLTGMFWLSLVIAICVQQQHAATAQRERIETMKSAGILPMTTVNGKPVSRPAVKRSNPVLTPKTPSPTMLRTVPAPG